MAGSKEIRTKIKSIASTQKITSAMQMEAASKMRRTQERMQASRPYAKEISRVIHHLAQSQSEYTHPFMAERDLSRAGILVVSSDRGLCGGLNSNLFKQVLVQLQAWEKQGVSAQLGIVGRKAEGFFSRLNCEVLASTTQLGDKVKFQQLLGVINTLITAYREKKIDTLYLAYNDFVNTMTQRVVVEKLLPIEIDEEKTEESLTHHWDYLYEPDARDLLDVLLQRHVESQIYQAVVENVASEQAARMLAMKNATDNAGNLIDELTLIYNKERQALITKELSEIVGGAAAV